MGDYLPKGAESVKDFGRTLVRDCLEWGNSWDSEMCEMQAEARDSLWRTENAALRVELAASRDMQGLQALKDIIREDSATTTALRARVEELEKGDRAESRMGRARDRPAVWHCWWSRRNVSGARSRAIRRGLRA